MTNNRKATPRFVAMPVNASLLSQIAFQPIDTGYGLNVKVFIIDRWRAGQPRSIKWDGKGLRFEIFHDVNDFRSHATTLSRKRQEERGMIIKREPFDFEFGR